MNTNTYCEAIQLAISSCQIAEDAEVALEVNIKGTPYKTGSFVVLSSWEYGLLFGKIQFIILNSNTEAYFVVQECKAEFNEKLHVYNLLDESVTTVYKCIQSPLVLDYYPLKAYRRGLLEIIPLKHAIAV